MRRDGLRRLALAAGLVAVGATLLFARPQAGPPPTLSLAVHPLAATPGTEARWSIDAAARGQDADVDLRLRVDGWTGPVPLAARLRARLCPQRPAPPPASACTAVLRVAPASAGEVSLGRIGTAQPGPSQRVLMALAAPPAGRPPVLRANVTPCGPAIRADLWRRPATRPQRTGDSALEGFTACGRTPPPWRPLGAALALAGSGTALAALLLARAR